MVLEIKQVKKDQAKKKPEIIKEISEVTGYTQVEVKDILRAFVAIQQRVNSNWSMELPWYALC